MSFTAEITEKTATGLDVAIKAEDGRIIAWTYGYKLGLEIADALSNFDRDGNGSVVCCKCGKVCCA